MHRLMEGTSPRHFDGTSLTPEKYVPILGKPCHCALRFDWLHVLVSSKEIVRVEFGLDSSQT